MKKFIAVLIIFTIGISGTHAQSRHQGGPKHTQGYRYKHPGYAIHELQRDVRQRIEFGIANGFLSKREGKKLMKEYGRIEDRARHYQRRGGLNREESRELIASLENLKRKVPFEIRERRGPQKGWARKY